ncbi:MAG TPA: NAD-dependent epimerase/dehydratase family protein [Alphaproteobacteria bacterium]|jgi:UDP-sulfoquinovose synthase|nr:NAD-dependent epimerase/dehydratase family protein [Alphaproteobacteria bacterium]HJM51243.1 NAD-dependent epimerase/dehydratase family protein [Alphaproteobacteria bacterium]
MRVLILGADGYLGWPTAMHFSQRGDEVMVVDNFVKRRIELEDGIEPLVAIPTLHRRVALWREVTGRDMALRVGDLTNHRFIYETLAKFQPDAIVHYAEQPSAPYSMQGREQAVFSQHNNVIGSLNLLFAVRKYSPDAHLVKLGTMGEYGTPNIDIEEGYITIEHKGRSDTLPFPKLPGSFYHLSKVHDSNNLIFACRLWGLRATDLNQGVVYGIDTPETLLHEELNTSFHYDHVFGTVLNRFCVQAVCGVPLTVYGKGGQTRGFLNIRDTIQCVDLAVGNPAAKGECRIFNQFTETLSINELAQTVQRAGREVGHNVEINHVENPRLEAEEHYYNPQHSKLVELGLQPSLLSEVLVKEMLGSIKNNREGVDPDVIQPSFGWWGDIKDRQQS